MEKERGGGWSVHPTHALLVCAAPRSLGGTKEEAKKKLKNCISEGTHACRVAAVRLGLAIHVIITIMIVVVVV